MKTKICEHFFVLLKKSIFINFVVWFMNICEKNCTNTIITNYFVRKLFTV